MSEPRPQFSYSPEGVLSLQTDTSAVTRQFDYSDQENEAEVLERIDAQHAERLETLANAPGVVVTEVGDRLTVDIDTAKRFYRKFNVRGDVDISKFLNTISHILPYHLADREDRVVTLDFINDRGSTAAINQHFQRWMNADGLSEEAAKESLMAMAQPFGADYIKKIAKNFRYEEAPGIQRSDSWGSYAITSTDKFGIYRLSDEEELRSEAGQVDWRWLNIATLGQCACWGVNGDDRERVWLSDRGHMRLYEMTTHNVDFARQSLSLVLGVGALAYRAAQYTGREDILSEAQWSD